MRRLRVLVIALGLAWGLFPVASAAADPVVCHDYPGGCCGEVTVAGKTVLRIDC